jgi:hypothetical protein
VFCFVAQRKFWNLLSWSKCFCFCGAAKILKCVAQNGFNCARYQRNFEMLVLSRHENFKLCCAKWCDAFLSLAAKGFEIELHKLLHVGPQPKVEREREIWNWVRENDTFFAAQRKSLKLNCRKCCSFGALWYTANRWILLKMMFFAQRNILKFSCSN